MDLANRDAPDTPLMAALASVRLKMNRQTMRFLGDASRRPTTAPTPSAATPSATTPPPAEGESREDKPPWRRSWHPARRRPGPGRWSRESGGRAPGRALRARGARGPGRSACCIKVRSPSVSILLHREDQGEPTVARIGPSSKLVIRVMPPIRVGTGTKAAKIDLPSDLQVLAVESQSRTEPGPLLTREPAASPAKEQECVPADDKIRNLKPESGDTRMSPSAESLNTYVRRKATNILHEAMKQINWFEKQNGSLEAKTSRERLLKQISRVAAYTAASRQLRHATNLYVVAGISSRRERRGVVRLTKLDCPPRQKQLESPSPTQLPSAKPPQRQTADDEAVPAPASSATSPVHINDLPKRLLLKVFSLLDQRELSLNAAPVCRAWHRLARSRHFWRELTFDAAFHQYSSQSVCNLLRVTPGLWTLELIACRDVDIVLAQVIQTCSKLRTLVVDSCTVSQQRLGQKQDSGPRGGNPNAPWKGHGAAGAGGVLEAVLEQCICLQYLIVAFTPHLYSSSFFSLLGRRCWSLQCFLVSADDGDVREFCESLSSTDGGEGERGREARRASQTLLGSLTGSWTKTVPPPESPAATASDNCHAAHPPRETSGLRRRVAAVRTRNHLLRMLALRPDAELRLLQWRLADTHATLDYFGVEARLTFQ